METATKKERMLMREKVFFTGVVLFWMTMVVILFLTKCTACF